jgi:hypothetical protein
MRGFAFKFIYGGIVLKEFKPQIEVFDPFKEPFSGVEAVVFKEKDLDACCACTACSACSACK